MSDQLIIRAARDSDLRELREIESECFHEDAFPHYYLMRLLRDPRVITLVATLGDRVVGFIMARIETFSGEPAGHIYTLDVRPGYRRRGIGSRLLESMEEILRRADVVNCYLEAREDNIAAISLYLKRGYTAKGILKDYYGDGLNGIRFVKSLREGQ